MGILIENIINDKKINDMSISESIINFTEECFSLEEYYNDIYNEQLNLEIKEFYNEEVDPDISSHETKNSFIQNAKNFFIKIIHLITY